MRRLAFALCLAASPVAAQAPLTGPDIVALVSGNTVTGTMLASGGYTEFYAPDGTIRGKDYTGAWTVEGDTMCFAYGADPKTCLGVAVVGTEIRWLADGAVTGTGMLVPGNPNNH